MNDTLIAALDDCLTALEQGADLEECLRRYPDLAEQLRPELEAVQIAQAHIASIQPSPEFLESSRTRFLEQAAALAAAKDNPTAALPANNGRRRMRPVEVPKNSGWTDFWIWLTQRGAVGAVTLLLVVVVMAGAGVLGVSAQSLPGDPLYGLKRAVEDTRLNLAPNGETRAQMEEEFDQQRRREVQTVTQSGRSVSLEFGGTLESISGESWSINGIRVSVPAGIEIKGTPQIGLYIHVHGSAQPDGTILAQEIRVEGEVFKGRLEQIRSGSWLIGGRAVFVNAGTRIKDNPQPGDEVEVKVMLLSDGSLLAQEIRLENRSGSSGKSGSGGGTPEPTPLPGSDDRGGSSTETAPGSGSDDHGGRTPEPDNTPESEDDSGSSSSTKTSEDNSGKGSSGSGSSTQALQVTKTGEPTRTIEPTRTPQPTRTPEPAKTSSSGSGGSGGSSGSSGSSGSGGSSHTTNTPDPKDR